MNSPRVNIDRETLEYALVRQVPDMERGCAIETNYGSFTLEPDDAKKVAALVKRLLEARLKRMTRHG